MALKSVGFGYHHEIPEPPPERLEYLRNQVKKLAQIPQPVQKSEEWLEKRQGMITASDWAAAIGEQKYPERSRNQLICTKCGEKPYFPPQAKEAMAHGVKYEPVANMIYEGRNRVRVNEFGLLPHSKYDFLGASPDGITDDGVMLEIKCPANREIDGIPPHYYWVQVQGQLEICELDRCDFLECKIEEYDDEEEYFDDHYQGDATLNSFGMEKGAVLYFINLATDEPFYRYSRLGIGKEDYQDWYQKTKTEVKQTHKAYTFLETHFWKLTKVSCIPIYRDQEWFERALPLLEQFWKDVLHYREVGIEALKPKKSEKKGISVRTERLDGKEEVDTSVCMFNLVDGAGYQPSAPPPEIKKETPPEVSRKCMFKL